METGTGVGKATPSRINGPLAPTKKPGRILPLSDNKEVRKFLIAGGNSTALVYGCPAAYRGGAAKKLLKEVEQVGFVSARAGLPKMTMMGGELCINATLAFASTLDEGGKLAASGLKDLVRYSNKNETATIWVPLGFKKYGNTILLEGIGFILYDVKEKSKIEKQELLSLSKKYRLPAFGGIVYDGNRITPYVYVKKVDSFVKETACGSGSIAFSIFSGIGKVIQPTGEKLRIKSKKRFFEVSAKVSDYA